MSTLQVLLLVVFLVACLGIAIAVWLRRRRSGGVLIASPQRSSAQKVDPS